MRACDNRFGYSLSVKRGNGSCAHHMISQLESTGKYVVVGEPKVFPTLSSILHFYAKVCNDIFGVMVLLEFGFKWKNFVKVFFFVVILQNRVPAGGEVLTQHCCAQKVPSEAQKVLSEEAMSVGSSENDNVFLTEVDNTHSPRNVSKEKRKPKLSKTRSHELGYGALQDYVNERSKS